MFHSWLVDEESLPLPESSLELDEDEEDEEDDEDLLVLWTGQEPFLTISERAHNWPRKPKLGATLVLLAWTKFRASSKDIL